MPLEVLAECERVSRWMKGVGVKQRERRRERGMVIPVENPNVDEGIAGIRDGAIHKPRERPGHCDRGKEEQDGRRHVSTHDRASMHGVAPRRSVQASLASFVAAGGHRGGPQCVNGHSSRGYRWGYLCCRASASIGV